MKVHHIGYLVKDNYESIKAFEEMGGILTGKVVYDQERQMDISFISLGGVF